MSMKPVKLGVGESTSETPVCYPDVWSEEQTTGPRRLLVGPASRHVEVLLSLAEVWRRDYYLLYVLVVPRLGKRAQGRYQSPGPLAFAEVAAFCRRFAPFLEGDGRHHLWIGSTAGAGLLVYDQHEWIYAYGDLLAYIDVLRQRGFAEGAVALPYPHSHHYHSSFDTEEDEVAAYWDWTHFPLQSGDEY